MKLVAYKHEESMAKSNQWAPVTSIQTITIKFELKKMTTISQRQKEHENEKGGRS